MIDKINTFNDWLKGIQNLLEIDDNEIILDKTIDNKHSTITFNEFYELCNTHTGWQQALMSTGDSILQKYLFMNGLSSVTDENIDKTRKIMIVYLSDFIFDYFKLNNSLEEKTYGTN